MTPAQMDDVPRRRWACGQGHEWDAFEGLRRRGGAAAGVPRRACRSQRRSARRLKAPPRRRAGQLAVTIQPEMSTQAGFGALLNEIGARRQRVRDAHRHHLARRHGLDQSRPLGEPARPVRAREPWPTRSRASASPRRSTGSSRPKGQHIELGIAEMNLFILLSALGLSHSINGERLLPIGTLYDPFIARGLDALNYACYQDARFIVVATPSGITLAPRRRRAPVDRHAADRHGAGRARQLRAGLSSTSSRRSCAWAFDYIQKDGDGGAIRAQLAARRDRRLGLSAALDAADRADQASR